METIEKLVNRAIVNGKQNYNALKKPYHNSPSISFRLIMRVMIVTLLSRHRLKTTVRVGILRVKINT
jgi:hypothetical protein